MQKQFFDNMAEKWDEFCKYDIKKIEYILDLLEIKEGQSILDIGTGTGVLLPFLKKRIGDKGSITAVDFSEKMLEIAKKKYLDDRISFLCKDIMEADLPDEAFNAVICYSVFPHFEKQQQMIKKISSCLKKSGLFMICHSQSRQAINDLHPRVSKAVEKDRLPSMQVIEEYILGAGLETVLKIDNDEMFVIVGRT